MKLTLLYFAHLAERTGAREESRELPEGCTIVKLLEILRGAHPKLGDALGACRIAIDEEFSDDAAVLHEGQTVAFIPPVSGG
jgi:molybdopterin synthase sulfur carrier subunit